MKSWSVLLFCLLIACAPSDEVLEETIVDVAIFNDSGATRIFSLATPTGVIWGPVEWRAGRRDVVNHITFRGEWWLEFRVETTYLETLITKPINSPQAPHVSCEFAYGEPARGPQAYLSCRSVQ